MTTRHRYTDTANTAGMSTRQVDALRTAAARTDHAVCVDRRTWRALYTRGLVDLVTGRGTDRHGETTYNVVTGVYINEKGLEAIK